MCSLLENKLSNMTTYLYYWLNCLLTDDWPLSLSYWLNRLLCWSDWHILICWLVIKCYFQSEILYKDLSVYQDDITNFIIGLKHSQVYYAIDLIFIYLVSKTELNLAQFKTLTRFYVKLITAHTVCWILDTAIKITSSVSQNYCHSWNFFCLRWSRSTRPKKHKHHR